MYIPVDLIEVRLWGRRIGAVALDPTFGYYVFSYDTKFIPRGIDMGIDIAPLQAPIGGDARIFVFPNLPAETFYKLPAFLADALPDKFGNAVIDAYMAKEGVTKSQITPLDRLAYIGGRGMGALEFKPVRGPKQTRKPSALKMKSLIEGARSIVAGTFNSDMESNAALANLFQVGTSAGGARAKAVIAWNRITGEIRPGQLVSTENFEHWLLKFDGISADKISSCFGRIEYAYSLMAKAAGITMTECHLLEENGLAHFMTKRFDREIVQVIGSQEKNPKAVTGTGTLKHHTQTLCAMSHLDFNQRGTHDYNQYFQVVHALELSDADVQQAFLRMAFNVVAANCDDHTKNFSFILRQLGPDSLESKVRWELAPAYDVTHAYGKDSLWNAEHLMSVNGKFKDILDADLLIVAERYLVPNAKALLAAVKKAVSGWPSFAKQANIPEEITLKIRADHISHKTDKD